MTPLHCHVTFCPPSWQSADQRHIFRVLFLIVSTYRLAQNILLRLKSLSERIMTVNPDMAGGHDLTKIIVSIQKKTDTTALAYPARVRRWGQDLGILGLWGTEILHYGVPLEATVGVWGGKPPQAKLLFPRLPPPLSPAVATLL